MMNALLLLFAFGGSPTDSVKPNPCASYIYVNDYNSFNGAPVYQAGEESVFWVSPYVGPGKKVLVKGAFTEDPKTITLVLIPPGLKDWGTLFDGSGHAAAGSKSVVVPAENMGSTAFNFPVPADFPEGSYAFGIVNSTIRHRINPPEVYWAMGIGPVLAGDQAGVNDTLRVMGVNFPLKGNLLFSDQGGHLSALPYQTGSPHEINILLAGSMPPGSYSVRVSPGNQPDALTSDPIQVILQSEGQGVLPVKVVNCSGLAGDGSTDNTTALNRYFAANVSGSYAVHFKLPPGNFLITNTLVLRPNQYIDGTGSGSTTITGSASVGQIPDFWIQGTQHFGVADLAITAPVKTALIGNYLNHFRFYQDRAKEGYIDLQRLVLRSTDGNTVETNIPPAIVQIGGPDLHITNVTADITNIGVANTIGFNLTPTEGGLFSRNTILLGNGGVGVYVYNYHHVIFDNNLIQGSKTKPGTFEGLSPVNVRILGSCSDLFVSRNSINDIWGRLREGMTTDLGGGAYFGRLESVGASSVVLKDPPNWSNFDVPPRKFMLTIVAGTGEGQFRYVEAEKDRTITLNAPWDVAPDQQSVVSISLYQEHLQVVDNTFENTGYSQFYGGIFNSEMVGNKMHNSMGLSLYSGIYFCASQPLENISLVSNSVLGSDMGDTSRNFGIRVTARYNCAISGVAVSDNALETAGRLKFEDRPNRAKPSLFQRNTSPNVVIPENFKEMKEKKSKGVAIY